MSDWQMPHDRSLEVKRADILGRFSTDDGQRPRWVEMTLVGTDNGYLIYGVGKSRVAGEVDRPWCKWWPEAFLVVRALLTPPVERAKQENTTTHARKMLQLADDEGIEQALARWRG